jgi:hypothetical protein
MKIILFISVLRMMKMQEIWMILNGMRMNKKRKKKKMKKIKIKTNNEIIINRMDNKKKIQRMAMNNNKTKKIK